MCNLCIAPFLSGQSPLSSPCLQCTLLDTLLRHWAEVLLLAGAFAFFGYHATCIRTHVLEGVLGLFT